MHRLDKSPLCRHTRSATPGSCDRGDVDDAAFFAFLQPLLDGSATHYSWSSQVQSDDIVPHLPVLENQGHKSAHGSIYRYRGLRFPHAYHLSHGVESINPTSTVDYKIKPTEHLFAL